MLQIVESHTSEQIMIVITLVNDILLEYYFDIVILS
jgi:hypothetical protein